MTDIQLLAADNVLLLKKSVCAQFGLKLNATIWRSIAIWLFESV